MVDQADPSLPIRILGIDPGSVVCGFGVIDSNGIRHRYVASAPIKTISKVFADRLKFIFEELGAVIDRYRPQVVAIEKAFMSRNADSALKLGQARGVAIVVAAINNLPVAEYTPRHIKQSVVGTGGASKTQVQHMVKVLLNYQDKLQADEADALAVALTHGHIKTSLSAMTLPIRAGRRRRRR